MKNVLLKFDWWIGGFTPGYRTGQKFELDPWGTYPGGVFKIKFVFKVVAAQIGAERTSNVSCMGAMAATSRRLPCVAATQKLRTVRK